MFSIVIPIDYPRLEQFHQTKLAYDEMPQKKEFIIVTRTKGMKKILKDKGLDKDVRVILYEIAQGFNCSRALNLGVSSARYDSVIITSPEVKPTSDVLAQFEGLLGSNVLAQVFDQDPEGNLTTLVSQGYRDSSPAMYFLAMFNKADIYTINGWDEEFMRGYAYEDNDFGERWNRAGLPFSVNDEITATHQYHPRSETIHNGTQINSDTLQDNNIKGVVRPMNGIIKL